MPRPIEALIDKHALQHNIALLREKAGKRFMWSVVKADAYGHGLHGLLDIFKLTDGFSIAGCRRSRCSSQSRLEKASSFNRGLLHI